MLCGWAHSKVLALTSTADRPPVCWSPEPSYLQEVALGLGAGPPRPQPPRAKLHLHLGGLELHSVPLQHRGEGRLPALQCRCQGPQQGRPGSWWLAHPAGGGQCTLRGGFLLLVLSRCPSSVHSPYCGAPDPTAHLHGEGCDPYPVSFGSSALRTQAPDPTALGGGGGLRLPSEMPMTSGFSHGVPLTQGQPGERPPRHLGYPWLRPQPRRPGDCLSNPGCIWSSGPQELGNGPR